MIDYFGTTLSSTILEAKTFLQKISLTRRATRKGAVLVEKNVVPKQHYLEGSVGHLFQNNDENEKKCVTQ
jgi:hypothetical protein